MKSNKCMVRVLFYVMSVITFNSFGCDEPIAPALSSVRFSAASVMPISWRHAPGQPARMYVLLSREAGGKDKGTYDDWGGSRDRGDHHPRVAAAREFLEEAITFKTIGMGNRLVNDYINVDNGKTCFVVVQEKVGGKNTMVTYVTFFSSAKIDAMLSKFYEERNKMRSWKYKEKDRLALVLWNDLAIILRNTKYARNVSVNAEVLDPKDMLLKKESITLRPSFVAKLRSFFKGNAPYASEKEGKILFFKRNISAKVGPPLFDHALFKQGE